MTGAWVSLFSGGKDSSWALYRALVRGLSVERLVTVHPDGDSYMYHVPATELCSLAAESIGIPLEDVRPDDFAASEATDAADQGDRELEPLEAALRELDAEREGGLTGVVVGAVESEYQHSRVDGMADRLGLDVYAPLWHEDPQSLAEAMLEAGFEIRIVRVAAGGLDDSWLGRRFDEDALEELVSLNETYGVHVLGEGGEFETLVTDGPHMERPIEIESEVTWDGTRGSLRITDAWLGE